MIPSRLIAEYQQKKNAMIEDITNNFDIFYSKNHDDLEKIIGYINYTDSLIRFLIDKAETNYTSELNVSEKHRFIERVIGYHASVAPFNQEKAREWVKTALNMIISDGWQYKPPMFIKGDRKIMNSLTQMKKVCQVSI